MNQALVWVNGERLDAGVTHVSALDRGFLLADGLFETVRIYSGRPFLLERHVRRLQLSAAALGFPGADRIPAVLEQALREAALEGVADAVLRLTLTRGPGFGVQAPREPRPTVVILVRPLTGSLAAGNEAGVDAIVASGRRNELSPSAGHKTLAFTDAVLALAEARRRGADETILLDTRGRVSEASYSNIFLVRGDALVTPSLECGPIPGITRELVLEMTSEIGARVEEREVWPAELAEADEMFATSSVREIVPIVRVDGAPVGDGMPGARTTTLRQLYTQRATR